MVRAGIEVAVVRRAKSSRAGVFGSSGWASGGSGFGSTLPLSCADAALVTPIINARAATRARLRGPGRRSAVMVLDPFAEMVAAPGRIRSASNADESVTVLAGRPQDRLRQAECVRVGQEPPPAQGGGESLWSDGRVGVALRRARTERDIRGAER